MMPSLYVGLMSGTSVDGIDACLASFEGGRVHEHDHLHRPFPPHLRQDILELARSGGTLADAATLDVELGRASAEAIQRLLEQTGTSTGAVRAVGSHGQTVLHRPAGDAPTSIQLGDPNVIAVATGIDTVADFRRADVAAGGEGAPLAPAFHATVFADPGERRAVVNLGGIANVTLLAPDSAVIGFDTGPANMLLDGWIARERGEPFDANGAWAASGTVDRDLLARMRADPWFERPPPKSTGRERFDVGWIDAHLANSPVPIAPADVQATLATLTATTVATGLSAAAPVPDRLIVCGGGARNADLLERLRTALPGTRVEPSDAHGVDPQRVEPLAFAWLARQRILDQPGNLPSVTGAARSLVLGSLVRAPRPDDA